MSNLDAKFNPQISRYDFPIILATNRHLATILGVRLAYDAAGYLAGTVLVRNSSSGHYEKYSASSGSYDAAAILFENVAAEEFVSPTGTALARGIFGGEVFKDKLVGLDAGAETELGAKTIVDASGVSILKF